MIHTEEQTDGVHIICEGDFTLTNATEIMSAFVASASRSGSEILSLANVAAMDVAGIQLAYCWKIAMERQDRNAKVVLPESESLKDLLAKTGITKLF